VFDWCDSGRRTCVDVLDSAQSDEASVEQPLVAAKRRIDLVRSRWCVSLRSARSEAEIKKCVVERDVIREPVDQEIDLTSGQDCV